MQVEGQFDLEAADRAQRSWHAELPVEDRDWSIGALIGPSGSGKTSLLRECFGQPRALKWKPGASVLDAFPQHMTIQEITGVLSSVGFSSPPAWLRPFETLSNGEQFRASVARLLCSGDNPILMDEFTSVVDRTVARIGSAAVASHVRRAGRRLIVASCHYDIVDWLQPDWVYDTSASAFEWRSLQRRPRIVLTVYRSTPEAWRWFAHHHYISDRLSPIACCLVGLVNGHPAAFSAAIPQIGKVAMRRESRVVTMPDFQGVGIGNRLSELHGSLWLAKGMRFRAVASHPAVVVHRARSPLWRMDRKPALQPVHTRVDVRAAGSQRRMTASFEYVGPAASKAEADALLG